MPRSASQRVTGNTVNRKVSNGGPRLRSLGARLIRATKKRPTEEELACLRGSVRHASKVNARQGRRLERLLAEVEQAASSTPPAPT